MIFAQSAVKMFSCRGRGGTRGWSTTMAQPPERATTRRHDGQVVIWPYLQTFFAQKNWKIGGDTKTCCIRKRNFNVSIIPWWARTLHLKTNYVWGIYAKEINIGINIFSTCFSCRNSIADLNKIVSFAEKNGDWHKISLLRLFGEKNYNESNNDKTVLRKTEHKEYLLIGLSVL